MRTGHNVLTRMILNALTERHVQYIYTHSQMVFKAWL